MKNIVVSKVTKGRKLKKTHTHSKIKEKKRETVLCFSIRKFNIFFLI